MFAYRRGFTLIELMIAIAIVAVLVSIALPTYRQHILKSLRSEAKVALMQAAQLQERNFTVNGTYVGTEDLAVLFGLARGAEILSGEAPSPATSFYALTVEPEGAGGCANWTQCFVLRATPRRSQTADGCGDLTLTSTGRQGVSGAGIDAADCWAGRR